jgi:hypothetical protein
MKGKILFSVLSVFCLLTARVHAADNILFRGEVNNSKTGEGIVNASISVDQFQTGTSSGTAGYFELYLPAGKYIVRISSLGYSEKEISLNIHAGMEYIKVGLTPVELEIEGVDVFGSRHVNLMDTSINRESLSLMPSITRINLTEIEKQGAVTLTDALKYVPGGWIETRGRKTKQFFSVRGQKYPYPDYSINGIWQKEFEETVYFFSAMEIESIEVVRSSSALVKGLSGLSGIVDVKTKRPDRESLSFSSKYGELNQYAANLRYGNKINELSINTAASLFGTDGPAGQNGRERIVNIHGDIEWDINERLGLQSGATYIGGSREFVNIREPGNQNLLNREEMFDPMRTLLSYLKLSYLGNCGSLTELQTNMAYRNSDHLVHLISSGTITSQQEKDYEYGFNLLHNRSVSSTNILRAGVLYNRWTAPNGKRYYFGRRSDVHTWSGVIASEQTFGRLVFDAGFRLIGGYINEWGGFGIEGSNAGFEDVRPVQNQASPLEWQSVMGASYMFPGASSVHYNFAAGTLSPRKGSLDGSGTTPLYESRYQHDLGYTFRSNRQIEITVSGFYNIRNNALELSGEVIESGEYWFELYENLDKVGYGLELSTRFNVPSIHSSMFANATFMHGKNEVNGEMVSDDKMPNKIFNGGLMFDYFGFDANFFANYTGPYLNNRFVNRQWLREHGDFMLGDFFSVDITAGYTITRKTSTRIFAEARNILDQKFLTVAGYPDPGRLFSVGARVHF